MSIFITGASGFIGGSLARALLDAGYSLRGLVRTPEKAALLVAMGIEPVMGSLKDLALLTREASSADAVVHAAKAEDLASAQALLAGLKGSGKTYLHTSGIGIVASEGDGNSLAPRPASHSFELRA